MRLVTAILVVAALALPAAAQKKQELGWPLDMDGDIRIHNYNGAVTLIAWDRDSVAVTAVVAGDVRPFGGGRRRGVKLGVESPGGGTAPLADFTVYVPARARVSIRGAATAIDVRGLSGTIDASTLGGRIRVAGPTTEVIVETMDGDVDVEASPTYLRARTASGRITWTGASDDVSLTTVSGIVVVRTGTLYRARIESITGDLRFTGTVKPDGRVTFDSHAGDITLDLSSGTEADVTVDAPKGTVLQRDYERSPGKGAAVFSLPRLSLGKSHPAVIVARSFKGRVFVTQP